MGEVLTWIHTHGELAFILALSANALLTAFVILLENREPEKSMAWFLALLVFPLVGFILYLFFGRNWHKRSERRRRRSLITSKRKSELQHLSSLLALRSPLDRSLRLLDASLTGLDPTDGNQVRVLTDAHEKYPRLFSAIRKATKSIDVEYYIFRNDDTGKALIDLLKERAAAGVAVRFLVDGMGSLGFGHTRFADMRAAGIACHYFSPLITFFYFLKANYRDHRKIVVIDDEVVFTGGINVGDEYLGKSARGPWRDTSLELRGPCVTQFADLFEDAWHATTGQARRAMRRIPVPLPGGEVVDVVPSGPGSDWNAIHQHYLALIHGAKRRVRIQTPYFIPDESLHSALVLAAHRGVAVEIMIPRHPDWAYLRWVAHTYLEDLLRAGVRAFEYRVGFLHTKAFLIDDELVSVGTCNVDVRSLRLDFEVNVLLSSPHSVRHMTEDFERDLQLCDEFSYAQFIHRPFWKRLAGSFARLISPLL
jgi:cardiolipin synthase A/B